MTQSITNPQIEGYLYQLAKRYDEPVLTKMEQFGHERHFPIIDRLVGALIHLMALSIGARKIFELGSGYGYSAYWFAKASDAGGKVICTDGDERNRLKAQEFLSEAGLWGQVEFCVGEAITTLKKFNGPFDIIYNDIDKGDYPEAWEAAKDKIRPGGLYIADNALWFGRVAEREVTDDIQPGWTEAIREHNKRIYADKQFDVTLLPLRDGVIVARRKTSD